MVSSCTSPEGTRCKNLHLVFTYGTSMWYFPAMERLGLFCIKHFVGISYVPSCSAKAGKCIFQKTWLIR
jgi:hypothetical protein